MLNTSSDGGGLCLFPNLGENTQSRTGNYDAGCSDFIDALYQVEEVPFHSRLAEFLLEMDVRVGERFFFFFLFGLLIQ